jgi:hypothetical protein
VSRQKNSDTRAALFSIPAQQTCGSSQAWQQQNSVNNKDLYTICNAAHLCHGLGLEAFQAVDVVRHAVGRALEGGDDEKVLQVGIAAKRAVLHACENFSERTAATALPARCNVLRTQTNGR